MDEVIKSTYDRFVESFESFPTIGFLALLTEEQRKIALSLNDINDCLGSDE